MSDRDSNPLDTDSEDDEKSAFWNEMQERFGGPITYEQIMQWEHIDDAEDMRSSLSAFESGQLCGNASQRENGPSEVPPKVEIQPMPRPTAASARTLPITGWLTPVTPHRGTHARQRKSGHHAPFDLVPAEVHSALSQTPACSASLRRQLPLIRGRRSIPL